ncbi:MAG: DUF1405 domain-containing protein [Firmicutes bacterium]|nr:DUF1405 domain-containing protein [Bacillota bacterium]
MLHLTEGEATGLRNWFKKPWFILGVILGNLFGTGLGFFWYQEQLAHTAIKYWVFIPDCPEFALFFVLMLLGIRLNRRNQLFEVITWFGLLKYGAWTVSTIGLFFGAVKLQHLEITLAYAGEELVLFVAHLGMFLEGLWLTQFLRLTGRRLLVTAGWFAIADYFDWVVGVFPRLPYLPHLNLVRAESIISTLLLIGILSCLYFTENGNNNK